MAVLVGEAEDTAGTAPLTVGPRVEMLLVEALADAEAHGIRLLRGGMGLVRAEIAMLLDRQVTSDRSRTARIEAFREQLAEALASLAPVPAKRRGGGKRGQRGAARTRRGSW